MKVKRYMKKLKRKIYIAVLLILVILIAISFPRLGEWLVTEDVITKSDIIVVLMGSVPDRTLEAVDVYQEGLADQIIVVNSYRAGNDILLNRGIQLPGDAQLSKQAAILLGVPEELILILDGEAKSTQDEAVIVSEYLKDKNEINSVILVTSQYHSKRSKKIFTKAFEGLDHNISVISSPSKYDDYNAKQWWKNRQDAKRVFFEYFKLINFYLFEQFQL